MTRARLLAWAGAAAVLAAFAVYSAGSVTHGFVSYYAASRLLVDGRLGPAAYDDRWFGAYVQDATGSAVREIFVPNPPPMAVMALPLAGLDAAAARAAWLAASWAAFVGAVWILIRAHPPGPPVAIVCLMMLVPAVFTNLRIGQGYLLVFALMASAVVMLSRGRDMAAGACLGALLALKTSGVALAVLLAVQRRWRALGAAGAVAAILALAVTPFIDASMWLAYPAEVRAYVERPASSVTAYQTTLGLFRRLCVADPVWNPSPAAECAAVAWLVPPLLTGGAVLVTAWLARRASRPEPWLAAAAALSVLTLPAVAEPHFVLLAIPLALVPLRAWELAAIAALLIVPLEITAERFTSGWWVLLAYPRLYAAWLLWVVCLRAVLTRERVEGPRSVARPV